MGEFWTLSVPSENRKSRKVIVSRFLRNFIRWKIREITNHYLRMWLFEPVFTRKFYFTLQLNLITKLVKKTCVQCALSTNLRRMQILRPNLFKHFTAHFCSFVSKGNESFCWVRRPLLDFRPDTFYDGGRVKPLLPFEYRPNHHFSQCPFILMIFCKSTLYLSRQSNN